MRPPYLTLVPAASAQRAVTAVRRALLGNRDAQPVDVADPDRIWDADEIGAHLLGDGSASSVGARFGGLARRARLRIAHPRSAPPAWRLHRRRFAALLGEAAPFDALSARAATELAEVADWVAVPPGGQLFGEGERLGHVYVVAQGRFDLSHGCVSLGSARSGSALGLGSALGASGAGAGAVAAAGGSVLRLPLAVVADAALCEPAFRAALLRLGDLRRLAQLLSTTAFADLCGPESRSAIAAMFTSRRLSRGEALWREGEVRNGFALVEAGRLALWMRAGAGRGERPIAVAGAGQALGLVASLRSRPSSGSLRAIEPTDVRLLDHDAFRTLLLWNPSLAGLPALLASRGQLVAGSFFGAAGAQPQVRPGWLDLAKPVARLVA